MSAYTSASHADNVIEITKPSVTYEENFCVDLNLLKGQQATRGRKIRHLAEKIQRYEKAAGQIKCIEWRSRRVSV